MNEWAHSHRHSKNRHNTHYKSIRPSYVFQDVKNTFNLEFTLNISEGQINVGLLWRFVWCSWAIQVKNESHWPPLNRHTLCPLLPITYPQL